MPAARQSDVGFYPRAKKNQQVLEAWDDTVWTVMVEKGFVQRNGRVRFVFCNGAEIEVGRV